MLKYSTLALAATLLLTNANASSLVGYLNTSDQNITVNGSIVAPEGLFYAFLGDNGATIVAGGKTISITDSHTPCLRDTPGFGMPYAWYMNVSVDGVLLGELCAQLANYQSGEAMSEFDVSNSTDGEGYAFIYDNAGLYSAYYSNLTGITNSPVTYSW